MSYTRFYRADVETLKSNYMSTNMFDIATYDIYFLA